MEHSRDEFFNDAMRNLTEAYKIWLKHFPTWRFECRIINDETSKIAIGYWLLDDITQKRKVFCFSEEIVGPYHIGKQAHIAQRIVDGIYMRGSKIPIVLVFGGKMFEINAEFVVKHGWRKSVYADVYAFCVDSVGAVEITPWVKQGNMVEGLFGK